MTDSVEGPRASRSRAFFVAVVGLALAALVGWRISVGVSSDPAQPQVGSGTEQVTGRGGPDGTRTTSDAVADRATVAAAAAAASGTVTTYRFVRAGTSTPLPLAEVYDARGFVRLGRADAEGRVRVDAALWPSDLVFLERDSLPAAPFVDPELGGYLDARSGPGAEVQVELAADSAVWVRELHCSSGAGTRVWVRTRTQEPAAALADHTGWRSLRALASLAPPALVRAHFGGETDGKVHVADTAGRVRLRFGTPGDYEIAGSGPGGEVLFAACRINGAPDARQIELEARPDLLATGSVVDARTGQPLAGVLVHSDEPQLRATTGADGTFVLGPFEAQRDFRVTAYGYVAQPAVTLTPGTAPRSIGLTPRDARTLTVTVRPPSGMAFPAGGGEVVVRSGGVDRAVGQLDATGRVRFALPVDDVVVSCTLPGFLARSARVDAATADATLQLVPDTLDARVDLRLSGAVQGTAHDAFGAPLERARVYVSPIFLRAQADASSPSPAALPRQAFVVTDAEGRFTFESDAVGDYVLHLEPVPQGVDSPAAARVGIQLGARVAGISLRLTR